MQKNKLTVLFAAAISLILYITASTGCISDQGTFNNVEISGYVRTESDSIPIPGVLVLVDPPGSPDTYTDENGFYEYRRTYPTGQGNPLELLVTAVDVDGESNGVFIAEDTLLYEEDTQHNLNIIWEVDFYVEILEDTTGTPKNSSLGYHSQ